MRLLHASVFLAVILCWAVFAGEFMIRRRPSSGSVRRRGLLSLLGIALHGVSFYIVWNRRRPWFTPFLDMGSLPQILLGLSTVGLAAGSVWIMITAKRVLDKQWGYAARLVEGHRLVAEGPYQWVRHPIYSALMGLLLATGLSLSRWDALLEAFAIGMIGCVIRIRSEDALLRQAFGQEWEAYAAGVPALFPRLTRKKVQVP